MNAQVTGTKTANLRIARQPSTNEGMTALHVAAQAGRVELVRYLLEKGANPQVTDANGKKATDLVSAGTANPVAPAKPAAASAAEIRALLENAASKK